MAVRRLLPQAVHPRSDAAARTSATASKAPHTCQRPVAQERSPPAPCRRVEQPRGGRAERGSESELLHLFLLDWCLLHVGLPTRAPVQTFPCFTRPISAILRLVDDGTSLRGSLLVATPALLDPNFARTVVLVAEHGEEGAMGVVLNRPSETSVGDAVPELASLAGDEQPLFVGGPVARDAVLALAEVDDPEDASELVLGDIGFVQDPDVAARRGRVFLGYAGWEAGQIESELVEQSWIVVAAEPDDVFSDEPDDLWSRVLRRQGGGLALLATMPLDPSLELARAAPGCARPDTSASGSARGVRRSRRRPTSRSAASTTVIARRLSTIAPSATPSEATARSRPYIDASRTPRPDGAKTASTATIAPTALVPPRNGIEIGSGSPPTDRSMKKSATPAERPRQRVEREQLDAVRAGSGGTSEAPNGRRSRRATAANTGG